MAKKQGKNEVIKFQAQVTQVKTMADSGIRITLDLPETATEVAWNMMECQRNGNMLEVVAIPITPMIQGVEDGAS